MGGGGEREVETAYLNMNWELGGGQSFGLPSKEDETGRMGQGHRLPRVWGEGSI